MFVSQFFRRRLDRSTRGPQSLARRRRPLLEALEGRQLLSMFTVTSASDSGSGTLRQAILSSNATSGTAVNTINFQIGSGGTQTIALKSALPTITHPVDIDGTTQPGYSGSPLVVLNGAGTGGSVDGLVVSGGSSTIRGLVLDHFSNAISLHSSNNVIAHDEIGTNVSGTAAVGNSGCGILVMDGSNNRIGGTTAADRNVISGNGYRGVFIDGSDSTGNLIEGNYIGTNAAGTAAVPNSGDGVSLVSSPGNTVGGTTPGAGNLISGNGRVGIWVDGSAATGNLIAGNTIGTDVTGSIAVGNGLSGVMLQGAPGNTIGGTAPGAGNVISGNTLWGVSLTDTTASDNTVQGNVISGNKQAGITLDDAGKGNLVEDDVIDSNSLSQPTAGSGDGVRIDCSPSTTVIDCTIDSNRNWGILISASAHTTLTNDTVKGNGLGGIHTT